MKTIEYRMQDKSRFGPGPWADEPDKRQWPDRETGLPCLIVRGPLGALCGYVGVTESHPWFRRDYDDSTVDISVHGGLTFAAPCSPDGDEGRSICHVPDPGEPDHMWWFGFDCCHINDLVPGARSQYPGSDDVYRDLDFVAGQCANLARQLVAAGR